ncbi:hypothetical protein [Piscinibacter sp. HJYY11]|uniref:hypothetical protein n=1 Tax=Piscinibacter sp. HJYY11 TaxID=2801333 RepID=UPI00191CB151|nr:hypothetical protein [Piscinibacter sp. HJYY11]MBL0729664.1 hypothetical protein [Piscinibacter sp. HJYY11]
MPALEYDARADEQCAASRGYEIKEEWANELNARLPEVQALWKTTAPLMFAAVSRLTGKLIDAPSSRIRLTLCDSPSQARLGISVNMRFALGSFTAKPVPLRYKIDTAFHEVLHDFTRRHVPKASPLKKLHNAESSCVLNHLHLLSLHKAVLLSLGEKAALENMVEIDSQLPSGCYSRAWAIVNEAEGTYKQYLQELAGGA